MKGKLWTKHFFVLIFATFALGISSSMMNSPLPMYARHIGGSDSVAGWVTGLFALSAMFCRPVFGHLLDHKGRKIILIFGISVHCIIVLSYHWAAGIVVLLVLRFLQGIGMSAYSTASGTAAADLIPQERIIAGFGYYGMIQTLALAIGPMVGLTLVESASYTSLFIISFLLGAVGLIAVQFISYEQKNNEKIRRRPRDKMGGVTGQKATVPKAVIEKTAVPVAAAMFFISLTAGAVMTFLPVYALSCGIRSIGTYFIVNAGAVLLTRSFTARLTDRFGISRVIYAGLLFLAASMVLLAFSDTLYLFLIAGMMNGLGNGVINPIMNALVVKFSPKERKGAANATYYAAIDIGIGAGSVLGGVVSQAAGYAFLYMISAVQVVVAVILYYIFIQRKSAMKNPMDIGILS